MPIMYKLAYVKRERKFGTVGAQFEAENDTKMDSVTALKSNILAHLPSYFCKLTTKIMINGFDPKIKVI